MKKIPTLFVRDPANRKFVLPEINPGCEWVLAGEGVPTRKYDGTCCAVIGGQLFKRQERKAPSAVPTMAELFVPHGWIEADHDPVTGKTIYWAPVGDGPEDRWHHEALANWRKTHCMTPNPPPPIDGTYELVGPKINGNPEGFANHWLVLHDDAEDVYDVRCSPVYGEGPPSAEGLFRVLRVQLTSPEFAHEGIVWHHPDGRMAKLKRRDFSKAPR